jgi:hypothetical protein
VSRDLDEQLLEQVGVRRRRLLDAVLWGRDRAQLAVPDNLTRFFVSVVVAALVCAGCVGWSFAKDALERANQNRQASTVSAGPR